MFLIFLQNFRNFQPAESAESAESTIISVFNSLLLLLIWCLQISIQSKDSGLGRSKGNISRKKRKRGRDVIDRGELKKLIVSKKSKTVACSPFEELVNELNKLEKNEQFCKFEITNKNTIKFDIKPNKKVFANFNIWNAMELFIRIVFVYRLEIVEFISESFGDLATKVKVQWLQNIVAHIKQIESNKEELFPDFQNWNDFFKCKYKNFVYKIKLNFIFEE